MPYSRALLTAASFVALSGAAIADPATGSVRNVVLVHGASADGSGWKAVANPKTVTGFVGNGTWRPRAARGSMMS